MREGIENQVRGLAFETVIPAFAEDFDFESKEEAQEAVNLLCSLVAETAMRYITIQPKEEERC